MPAFNKTTNDLPKKKIDASAIQEWQWLYYYLKPYRSLVLIGLLVLLLSTIPTLMFPRMTGILADIANGKSQDSFFNSINKVCGFLAIITLGQAIFSFIRVWIFSIISENSMADIRQALYNNLIELPISFYEKHRIGELNSRISADVQQLQDTLSISLAEFLRGIVTLIAGLIFILWIIPGKLTLLMLSVIPVFLVFAMVFGKKIRQYSKHAQDTLAQSNVVIDETLHNINTVKAFTNEAYETNRYKTLLQKSVNIALRSARFRGAFISFVISGFFGALVLILWFGFKLIQQGQMTIGELISFMMYSIFIAGSVVGMGELYAQLQKSLGATERLRQLLKEPKDKDLYSPSQNNINGNAYSITIKDLSFSYPSQPEKLVLEAINLEINKNQTVAIVGKSGSGKSTIAQLLMRLYTVPNNSIFLNEIDCNEYSLKHWREQIAIVPQEILLFGGTIKENIAYANPNASIEEITDAAKQAYCWEFIEPLPEGLDTIIGERGMKLSGGQRQRLAIARALLKKPQLMILDEATSALDSESEMRIQKAINNIKNKHATLIIAHRLSTIRNADCIIVMSQGKIVESGSYESLMSKEGLFFQMVEQQQMFAEV